MIKNFPPAYNKLASSLTAFSGGTVRSWRQIANLLIIFRMWRNEVNMRKRERTRQQAEELRKDKGHVYIHIKAVIDRITIDVEDCKNIERIKKAIKGDDNVAIDSTVENGGQDENKSKKEINNCVTKEEESKLTLSHTR